LLSVKRLRGLPSAPLPRPSYDFYLFPLPSSPPRTEQVRQISLSNVVSTNAYIMIFEMEPTSSTNCQSQGSQLASSSKSENSLSKTAVLSFTHSNGLSSKLLDSNGSKPSTPPSKNGENSSSKSSDREDESVSPTPPPPPPPPQPALLAPNVARRNFIGPQLPPHMAEKNR
jgi:hypothetical protein